MARVSPGAFRDALRELPDEAFASFVADLYRARGHDVRLERSEDASVVVVVSGDDERRLLVHRPGLDRFLRRGPDPGAVGADAVVTDVSRPGRGVAGEADVVDADRLRELALFGIGRRDRAELFDRLGVSPATLDPRSASTPWRSGIGTVRRLHLLAAVAALALIVAALVGLPGDTGGSLDASAAEPIDDRVTVFDGQGPVPGPDDGSTPTPTATAGAAGAANASAILSQYPIGVEAEGIVSGAFLARNHARLLEDESYRLEVSRQEFVDGNRTGYRREVLYVVGPRRAYSTQKRNGTFRSRTFVTDDDTFYVNDSVAFVRSNGTVRQVTLPDEEPGNTIAGYASTVLNLLLPRNSSRGVEAFSRNGTQFYRIPFANDATFGQHNVTGYAVLDERGLVHDARRRWSPEGTNVTAVVRVRTLPGNVTLDRPAWLDAHREREVADTNATTAEDGAVAGAVGRWGDGSPVNAPPVRTAPGRDQPALRTAER